MHVREGVCVWMNECVDGWMGVSEGGWMGRLVGVSWKR